MPIHDWTRVPAGLFHHFDQSWTVRVVDALNAGVLPAGFSALVEQRTPRREADVPTLDIRGPLPPGDEAGVVAVAEPETRTQQKTSKERYAQRANRVTVRHGLGRIAAVVEVVTPGNKDREQSCRDFVEKAVALVDQGVNLLVVDLFPSTRHDPQTLHREIWRHLDPDEVNEYAPPPGQERLLVSYRAVDEVNGCTAYIEPLALGAAMPDMPLFLDRRLHVPVPLESTYEATWQSLPAVLREVVETGVLPDAG